MRLKLQLIVDRYQVVIAAGRELNMEGTILRSVEGILLYFFNPRQGDHPVVYSAVVCVTDHFPSDVQVPEAELFEGASFVVVGDRPCHGRNIALFGWGLRRGGSPLLPVAGCRSSLTLRYLCYRDWL